MVVVLSAPVSILMPVCNEADIIEGVIEEWRRDVIEHLPAGSELVFDDCSTDGTEKILAGLAAKYSWLRVNTAKRDGFFNSALRLYRLARCPLVFFTDSDGQYVAEDFWKIAAQIEHADMVHGAKDGRQDPWYRLAASRCYNLIVGALFNSKARDVNSAFRLIRRPMLEATLDKICRLKMLPNSEMYLRAEAMGFRIVNVDVRHRQRENGVSRSLPMMTFMLECKRALFSIFELRRDLTAERKARSALPPVASQVGARQ